MSTLKEQLRADLNTNMKAGNKLQVATLRMLLGAIATAEKAGKVAQDFDDAQVQDVLAREVKKRREAAGEYRKAPNGAGEARAVNEEAEAAVLETYLPEQISEAEIERLVDAAIAESGVDSIRGMGQVMKIVTAKTGNTADKRLISELVRARLGA